MSLVKYEGVMDPITNTFDTRRQAVYLYELSRGKLRSKAAKTAGVRLAQVNQLRKNNEQFRELEEASLEEAAEGILESMQTLAEQGDVKAADSMLRNYFMSGTYGAQGGVNITNNTLVLESGADGIRNELERLRTQIAERAT